MAFMLPRHSIANAQGFVCKHAQTATRKHLGCCGGLFALFFKLLVWALDFAKRFVHPALQFGDFLLSFMDFLLCFHDLGDNWPAAVSLMVALRPVVGGFFGIPFATTPAISWCC